MNCVVEGLPINFLVKELTIPKKLQLFTVDVKQHVAGDKMPNSFCPSRGSNQDLLHGSQTLYRVDIKAAFYRKVVQVSTVKFLNFGTPEIFAVIYLKL